LALLPSSSRKVVYVHTPCIVGGGQGGKIQNMKNMDFVSTWTCLHVDHPPLLNTWAINSSIANEGDIGRFDVLIVRT